MTGFLLVAAGGGTRGGVCRRGLGVLGAGGGPCAVLLQPGFGGGRGGVVWGRHCWCRAGRGRVLCWMGGWASCRVAWVLRVRAVGSLLSLAGCGAEVLVGGGCLGIRLGLWSVGRGWLLVDGACWGVGGGAAGVVGCFL